MKLRCRRCVRGVRERSRRRHFEPSLERCQCLARNERLLNSAAIGARQGAVRTADQQHPPTDRQLGALSETLRHDLTHPASMRADLPRTRPGRGASRTLVRFGWMPPRTIRCALNGFSRRSGAHRQQAQHRDRVRHSQARQSQQQHCSPSCRIDHQLPPGPAPGNRGNISDPPPALTRADGVFGKRTALVTHPCVIRSHQLGGASAAVVCREVVTAMAEAVSLSVPTPVPAATRPGTVARVSIR